MLQAAQSYRYDEVRASEHLARPAWQVSGSLLRDPKRAYTGPVFEQVGPTCSAWATIHAAYAVGRRLAPSVVVELVNGGLKDSYFSLEEDRVGLDFFKAADIIAEADDAGITYELNWASIRQTEDMLFA